MFNAECKIQMGADQCGVVSISQCIVCNTGLFNAEVFHGGSQRFLILVSAGLIVVDQLKIDPFMDPVPVQIMDDDILFHDPLIIVAPGKEGDIVTAPFPELLEGVLEGNAVGQTLRIESGQFLYFVVHPFEIDGTDIHSELLTGTEVLIQFNGADFYDLSPQMDRKLVEDRGFGTHCLVPLKINYHIIHKSIYHSF